MICTAHRLQFSVRNILDKAEISSICNKIRKTVRFFRKSSISLLHLKRAFESSNSFKHPLRPLLYVKTLWGSTFKMFQIYIAIQEIIKDAEQTLIRDMGENSANSVEQLTAAETILVEDLIRGRYINTCKIQRTNHSKCLCSN